MLSSLALILLYWQWQPMIGMVWDIGNPAGCGVMWALFWAGWAMVLIRTLLIGQCDLFGLRQVYLNIKGREYRHRLQDAVSV